MSQIIPPLTQNVNSLSSVGNLPINKLPKFHQKLLNVFYEDRLSGVDKSDRSLGELGRRFDRHPDYISRCLSELTKWGKLAFDPHGSAYKKRWITLCAFSELENKRSSQTSSQILATPYIDLLSEKELINSKILKEPQECGKPHENKNLDLETRLNSFLDSENIPITKKQQIKSTLNTSKLSVAQKETILDKVIARNKKRLISDKRNYFKACVENEQRKIIATLQAFQAAKSRLISVSFY